MNKQDNKFKADKKIDDLSLIKSFYNNPKQFGYLGYVKPDQTLRIDSEKDFVDAVNHILESLNE